MSKGIMLMEINQPIGSFYIGKINSGDLIKISKLGCRFRHPKIIKMCRFGT